MELTSRFAPANGMLVHMLSARHSKILQKENETFAPPILLSAIEDNYVDFSKSTKKSTFSWEQRVIEIVVRPGNKWMDDVHTIYTPMLWNESH